jgi:hypothetical protein
VLLALPKLGATYVSMIVAAVILAVAFLVASRPRISPSLIAAVLLVGGVLVIGSGIIAAAVGEREFHKIGEEHGEEHEELDVGESGETHDDEGVREDAIGVLVLER